MSVEGVSDRPAPRDPGYEEPSASRLESAVFLIAFLVIIAFVLIVPHPGPRP